MEKSWSPLAHARGLVSIVAVSILPVVAGCSRGGGQPPDLGVGDARLVEVSPIDGEAGVAIGREVILRFEGGLSPASVDAAAVRVELQGTPLATRLHLAPTRDTLTVFPVGRWPGGGQLELVVVDGRLRADSGRPADLDGDGRIGGGLRLSFRVTDLTRVADTDLCGRVFASEPDGSGGDVPLAGVTVTVDGLETECVAVTDPLGNFCLEDTPAGEVFVHIRGATAAAPPAGFYYPDVGKTWHSSAGQRSTVGTVFLPAVSSNALQPVSRTADTSVLIVEEQLARVVDPQLAEQLRMVMAVVPADSLFADDGSRGGRVGLAPVNRDRLPGTLPVGLQLPIVITVQTDGASNFDRPVPVCFPNLPDPATGLALAPGARSALWSFNHDTGRFEVVGPMTVSADGLTVCTDPGVGIRAPGWHGSAQGTPGSGGPPPGPCVGPECCQGPDCCKKTIWNVIADVARVAADLAYCIVDFTRIGPLIQCLIDTVRFCEASVQWALAVAEIAQPEAGRAELIELKNRTRERIEQIVALIDSCGRTQTVGKIEAVINCLEAIADRAAGLCREYRNCTQIIGQERACALVDQVRPYIAAAFDAKETINSYIENGIRGAALTALHRALTRVCSYLETDDPVLTPEQAAELRQLFREASEAFPPGTESGRITAYLGGGYREPMSVVEAAASLQAIVGPTAWSPQRRILAYALECPLGESAGIRRGHTTPAGAFEALLPPQQDYVLRQYDPLTRMVGVSYGVTAANGTRTTLRPAGLAPVAGLPDTDGDGLADAAEAVYGTSPTTADSDADGVSDGDEVHTGRDPLDGVGGRVRLLGDLPTVGPALDICADDGAVVVACGAAGIEVFNAWQNLPPASVARLDTPGEAVRVACARYRVAVADGSAGLAIVDLTAPAQPVRTHQLVLGNVRAVAAAAGVAVAGTQEGRVVVVDLDRGIVLMDRAIGEAVVDLAISGDVIHVLSDGRLRILRIQGGVLAETSQLAIGRDRHRRLCRAQDHVLTVHWSGFVSIDVSDPSAPRVMAATATGELGWRHMAMDGSGHAIVLSGPNSNPDPQDDVFLYALADPAQPGLLVRNFADPAGTPAAEQSFPALPQAVPSAVTIYNGLAYIADRRGRLLALRYRLRDLAGQPPTIAVATSARQAAVEEGKVLVVRADVADDVQVSHVDFELDGRRLLTDGTYPFTLRMTAPSRQVATALTLGAKCWDTGGSMAVATTVVVQVTPDTTAPGLVRRSPAENGAVVAGSPLELVAVFDEPVDPVSVTVGSLLVTGAGPDGLLGTADDEPVVVTSALWRQELQTAIWSSTAPLREQRYRAVLSGVADVAGNPMAAVQWDFAAFTGLRLTFYNESHAGAVTSLFQGLQPIAVTEYRAGTAPRSVTSTVVPTVHFLTANGAWAIHAGADGVWQTSSLTSPVGDDVTWATPGDRFGVLLEGALLVPQAGEARFHMTVDDAFALELGGQVVWQHTGCQGPTTFTSGLMSLAAGPTPLRLGASDLCGSHFHLTLAASGAGFPSGPLPPSAYGAPR